MDSLLLNLDEVFGIEYETFKSEIVAFK